MLLDSLRTEAEADFKLLTDITFVKKEEWIKKINYFLQITCSTPLTTYQMVLFRKSFSELVITSDAFLCVWSQHIFQGDYLHYFIAILPQIQESRCSGTLKSLYFFKIFFVFFFKFQMFVFVNLVHTAKILASEKTVLLYRKNMLKKYWNAETRNTTCKWHWWWRYIVSDMKRIWMSHVLIFSIVFSLMKSSLKRYHLCWTNLVCVLV